MNEHNSLPKRYDQEISSGSISIKFILSWYEFFFHHRQLICRVGDSYTHYGYSGQRDSHSALLSTPNLFPLSSIAPPQYFALHILYSNATVEPQYGLADRHTRQRTKKKFLLWSNQQMHLYAVNFIPLLGSLYMFRVFYTPIIRSTIYNCIYSHWYKP